MFESDKLGAIYVVWRLACEIVGPQTALIAALGLFFLFDPIARQKLRTSGPYLSVIAFVAISAPHLWWLVEYSFLPFQHVLVRAKEAKHWHDHLVYPFRWLISQLFFLLPTIGLLSLVLGGGTR